MKNYCPICDKNINFFSMINPKSKNLLEGICPSCKLQKRHRSAFMYFKEKTNIFTDNISLLHIAPEKKLAEIFLSLSNIKYYSIDLNEKRKYVQKKSDLNKNIPYNNNTFNIIYCCHVLEHIENDIQAMKEMYRVLKSNGKAIIQVPFKEGEIYENYSITSPKMRKKHFNHPNHVRIYSIKGIKERLSNIGFNIEIEESYINDELPIWFDKYPLIIVQKI